MPNIFDDFFAREPFFNENGSKPAVNIKEKEAEFGIELVAPGFSKEDFKIEMNEDMLTISAEHKSETKNDTERYSLREYVQSTFERSFRLPENKIDVNNITGKYEDGILKIQLPKKAEQKAQKKLIEVA